RIAIRLSPFNPFNDMSDENPYETYGYVIAELGKMNLAYLHLLAYDERIVGIARETFKGPLILNGGFDREKAEAAIAENLADAVAFGVPYLANPDLPIRMKLGAELNPPNPATFYGGGVEGYTDYPTLAQAD
ncbi:MAG: alkene reductase, partial [Chloroflexota bacterium]